MRVLVTGAAGFIGSRLTDVLLEGGHTVAGFDIMDGGDPPGWQEARLEEAKANHRFLFFQGDVMDLMALDLAVAKFKPDAVVHLASRRDLVWADQEPEACMRLHVEGCVTVMKACNRHNIAQVIIGSSSHVYGGSRQFPFSEKDCADNPLSVFGAAARASELFAYTFSLNEPICTTVARIFSVYGPRQSPDRLVAALAGAAERRVPMRLFGDGTAGRDMIYVDDVVVGILRIMDRPMPWRVLNLGSGKTTTLGQVAEQMSWIADVAYSRESAPRRAGEMPNTFSDTKFAKESIGFSASIGLEDGLRRTWEWFRDRPVPFRRKPERRQS
jgi:UDP-glucuronate 4-epimerase